MLVYNCRKQECAFQDSDYSAKRWWTVNVARIHKSLGFIQKKGWGREIRRERERGKPLGLNTRQESFREHVM